MGDEVRGVRQVAQQIALLENAEDLGALGDDHVADRVPGHDHERVEQEIVALDGDQVVAGEIADRGGIGESHQNRPLAHVAAGEDADPVVAADQQGGSAVLLHRRHRLLDRGSGVGEHGGMQLPLADPHRQEGRRLALLLDQGQRVLPAGDILVEKVAERGGGPGQGEDEGNRDQIAVRSPAGDEAVLAAALDQRPGIERVTGRVAGHRPAGVHLLDDAVDHDIEIFGDVEAPEDCVSGGVFGRRGGVDQARKVSLAQPVERCRPFEKSFCVWCVQRIDLKRRDADPVRPHSGRTGSATPRPLSSRDPLSSRGIGRDR